MRIMKCESLMDRNGVLHIDKIVFPKLLSPKFDGNRCYVEGGQAKSSSGKPIRNKYIREKLSDARFEGFDGEIVVGPPTAKDVRRATSSAVGRTHGEPDFTFYVFDDRSIQGPFEQRLQSTRTRIALLGTEHDVSHVEHDRIATLEAALEYESWALGRGYEGVILRDPTAPYKEGRATLKQNWALKLKRFVDGEAVILGFYERMHNDNEKTTDEHGYAKRSSHAENKRPAGDLGGFEVKDTKTEVVFCVGNGFDAALRCSIWAARNGLVGKIITYKHFPVGAKEKPNLPSFVAFRDEDDMGEQ